MLSSTIRTMSNAAGKKKIEFYYDIFSPYTWFAFEVLVRYKKHWDMDLQMKPFFLAAVAKAAGNTAPMLVPNKAYYMGQDLVRNAKYFDVPLKMVSNPHELVLGKGSLVPNRFLIATQQLYPQYLEPLSRALWMEVWNKDEDFTQPEVLTRAALSVGMSQAEVKCALDHIEHQDTKSHLKANTDQAIEYRAFGSPSIVAHVSGKEPMMFFGSDRFPILAQEIGEKWLGPNPDAPIHKL